MSNLHWIDNTDCWRCPICDFETHCPSNCAECKCPKCGFQDEKDAVNFNVSNRKTNS